MFRLCLIFASLLVSATPCFAEIPQATNDAAYYSMVRIWNAKGNSRSGGSGTYINDGFVVSCAHVFGRSTPGEISVSFLNGHKTKAKLIAIDHLWDLSLLQLEEPPSYFGATFASKLPGPGTRIFPGGYGGQGRPWMVDGKFVKFTAPAGASVRDDIEVSGAARQGDSGGPMFDENGRLVGVLWGTNGSIIIGTQFARVQKWLFDVVEQPKFEQVGILFNGRLFGRRSRGGCYGGQCSPGQPCYPGGGRSGGETLGGGNVSQPASPPEAPDQSEPDYGELPPAPYPSNAATKELRERIDELEAQIIAINSRVDSVESDQIKPADIAQVISQVINSNPDRFRGPAGRDGEQGPAGIAGPIGPKGSDGKDAKIDIDAIAQAVSGKLPPISIQTYEHGPKHQVALGESVVLPPIRVDKMADGKAVQSINVPLGGYLELNRRVIPANSFTSKSADEESSF